MAITNPSKVTRKWRPLYWISLSMMMLAFSVYVIYNITHIIFEGEQMLTYKKKGFGDLPDFLLCQYPCSRHPRVMWLGTAFARSVGWNFSRAWLDSRTGRPIRKLLKAGWNKTHPNETIQVDLPNGCPTMRFSTSNLRAPDLDAARQLETRMGKKYVPYAFLSIGVFYLQPDIGRARALKLAPSLALWMQNSQTKRKTLLGHISPNKGSLTTEHRTYIYKIKKVEDVWSMTDGTNFANSFHHSADRVYADSVVHYDMKYNITSACSIGAFVKSVYGIQKISYDFPDFSHMNTTFTRLLCSQRLNMANVSQRLNLANVHIRVYEDVREIVERRGVALRILAFLGQVGGLFTLIGMILGLCFVRKNVDSPVVQTYDEMTVLSDRFLNAEDAQ